MDRELEEIKGEMHATRESLTEKLGMLEDQVRETVSSAGESVTETIGEVKEAVASTVDGVKEVVSTVSDSVSSATDSVKEAFNLSRQVEEHPWAMMGAAVAVGCIGGYLLGGLSRRSGSGETSSNWTPSQTPTATAATPASPSASSLSWSSSPSHEEQKPKEPGLFDSLFSAVKSSAPDVFGQVVTGLEGLAVGSLAGVARDLINQAAPETWREGLADMVGDVAQQLTGKRLEDLSSYSASEQAAEDRNGGSTDYSTGNPTSSSRVSAQL